MRISFVNKLVNFSIKDVKYQHLLIFYHLNAFAFELVYIDF
jgi:hypothetical protein